MFYWKLVSPVSLGGKRIPFSNEADHIGFVKSIHENLSNILSRISAHKRALMAVLPAGLARGHRGNPAASLHIQVLYGAPKLLSRLSSQILSLTEKKILHQHYKAVVHFLRGSLPLTGLLELRQINLLGIISRLDPSNILHRLAVNILPFLVSTSDISQCRILSHGFLA